MLRVSWVDHVKKEDSFRRDGMVEREFFENIKKRKVGYIGHKLRGE